MAEYVQKDMTGSMFPNDKGDNPNRPDMRGTVTIGGTKYSLSAWHNEAQSTGNKYLSLKVSEYQEKSAQPATASNQQIDDSIPF